VDTKIIEWMDEIKQRILSGKEVGGLTDLYKSLGACVGENIVIDAINGKAANSEGHDAISGDNPHIPSDKTVETKAAMLSSGDNYIGVYNVLTKRGKCNYLGAVDMNTRRISLIPHDDLFSFLDKGGPQGGILKNFKWSKHYNGVKPNGKKCRSRIEATKLFLKYEVIQ
jgi:hypothetical protein